MDANNPQTPLYQLSDANVIGADPWLRTRLDHPEDVTVATDGTLYSGGEAGQLYKIDPDTNVVEEIGNTGGFVLGITLGPAGDLYACDFQQHAVFRLPLADGEPDGTIELVVSGDDESAPRHPNYCTFDSDGRMYVSDSGDRRDMENAGGCLYSVEPDGTGRVLTEEPAAFPNGLALSADGTRLYVAETGTHDVSVVELSNGKAQAVRHVTGELGMVDGLALDGVGRLYAASIGDNAVYRLENPQAPADQHRIECIVHDPEGLTINNPTNVCFGGPNDRTLYVANLGLWHLAGIELDGRSGSDQVEGGNK